MLKTHAEFIACVTMCLFTSQIW